MTILNAVNIMLDGIGEDRVNSLDTGYTEATLAKKVLENTSRSVQSKGWYFNRDLGLELHKNDIGKVPLPSNILSVSMPPNSCYVQRGLFIYDRVKHTFAIDKDIKANVVVELAFSDLPTTARDYITIVAAKRFQEQVLGSISEDSFQMQAEKDSYLTLLEDETISAQYNIYNNVGLVDMMYRGV